MGMRDPETMIALLKEMESKPDGQLVIGPATFGMSIEKRKERHHLDPSVAENFHWRVRSA